MARHEKRHSLPEASRLLHLAQVFLQFVGAITVIGLNAAELEAGSVNAGVSVLAISAGCLSTITVVFFAFDIFFPFPSRLWLLWVLFWQWCLTLLWLGVTAAYGRTSLGGHSIKIDVAAGVSIANTLLWLLGSLVGTTLMCFRRKLGGKSIGMNDLELTNYTQSAPINTNNRSATSGLSSA